MIKLKLVASFDMQVSILKQFAPLCHSRESGNPVPGMTHNSYMWLKS